MNKLLNQKLLFLISLLCVVTVTVGAVFLPRYLSRGLDKSRLNKVTVSDRSHFSYLEQSSGGIIENIQALSFMKSEANLMLLSDMKADTARLNTDLLENVYNQAMIASEYGMLPWLGVGDYKTLRKSSYDVVTDWEDDIRFARYYSLTYDSDNDENTKELLNLWFLRFSDNNTFDYYFLVDASDYTIYYAEIHNDWTAAEAEAMEIIKAESGGNEINITISEGIDQSAILDVSDSSLETGVLWYYNAESCRYVVGDYTNSYHVDVREKIDAFSKFSFESQFQKISSGGSISYVEIPNMRHNLEALEEVVKFIYDNIQYAEFNTKSDYCHVCGYDGEIKINDDLEWECPQCGNKDHSKMNVTRRTCGYLGENFWNVGKTKEINARVMHL